MKLENSIDTIQFAQALAKKVSFFAGVPDSLLQHLCSALERCLPTTHFVTAANEGAAVALAAGHTLATGCPGGVFMQNSGIGNAINPLLSLNDSSIYSFPALLLIGWRGEPGTHDEPQHRKQGLVTGALLDACGIPYQVLPDDMLGAINALDWAIDAMDASSAPAALVIRKNTFAPVTVERKNGNLFLRETAIETILGILAGRHAQDYRIISSTGMISRELYELRDKRKETHDLDFLAIGSMGHASQIAMGLAIERPSTKIICLDGDGAMLMHMGSLAVIGQARLDNFIHIVLNNEAHDSVGGSPTCAGKIAIPKIARACGYSNAATATNTPTLAKCLENAVVHSGSTLIEVKVAQGARPDLGRPTLSPKENKDQFTSANYFTNGICDFP